MYLNNRHGVTPNWFDPKARKSYGPQPVKRGEIEKIREARGEFTDELKRQMTEEYESGQYTFQQLSTRYSVRAVTASAIVREYSKSV